MSKVFVESVPNFSVARDKSTVEAITKSFSKARDVKLLHVDQGVDANRTVFTLVGEPGPVCEALFDATKIASKQMDMRKHSGSHPRIGALDVCPFIPIKGITEQELKQYVLNLGQRLGEELNIPVFYYEESAQLPERKNLANIRKGGYEGLEEKMKAKEWQADNGRPFNAKTGATAMGVRKFLLAYNVNLETNDLSIAKEVAQRIRESGYVERINGQKIRHPGYLKGVKAIGWYVDEFECCQVSTNITDINLCNIAQVFEACKKEAASFGIEVLSSELIGLLPYKAFEEAAKYLSIGENREEDKITKLTEKLGLNIKEPFQMKERIIEFLYK